MEQQAGGGPCRGFGKRAYVDRVGPSAPRPRRPATIGGLVSWPLAREIRARGARHLAGIARRVVKSQRSSIRCARADATLGLVPSVLLRSRVLVSTPPPVPGGVFSWIELFGGDRSYQLRTNVVEQAAHVGSEPCCSQWVR